ncbi:diguanylate cyclase (GGDEF) domain-containing protein [Andreprevotia lacus DSM 23236]|uniref:diguanylate cyclase n=1 Tax=Andreprevotia lacus DSM 23236 TaxID=1121001 RepID=A0A1W1XY87_9NEIS|nr:GGDEF domain-containing protein [Andreprevotia lacus]SMC28886.1 diguanylate cyclase (GGDEF) domain-containing protein [Andreprevotia lacus DSM 23236]
MYPVPLTDFLHPRSILTLAAAVFFTSGFVMTLMGVRRRVYPGYWHWVAGEFAFALSALAIACRDMYSVFWSIHLGNALLLLQPVLIAAGLRRFLSQTIGRRERVDYLLWAFAYGCWLLSMLGNAPAAMPIFIFSLGFLLLSARLIQLGYRNQYESLQGTLDLLLGSYALCALTQLARGIYSLTSAQTGTDPLFGLSFIAFVLLAIITLSTLLLMNYERAEGELRAIESQLMELANTDVLTGIPNRRHFMFLAERLQAIAARGPRPALLIIDVDHFKEINDARGHLTGDMVLRAITGRIGEVLRGGDTLGRLGGDEFAVLLPGSDARTAGHVASRIVKHIRTLTIADFGPAPTLSIGMAEFMPGDTVSDVMRRADQALYAAKRAGRNCAMTPDGVHCSDDLEEAA